MIYQHFLDFFKLTGRDRFEGLDKGYFSAMTEEEKNDAFEFLKSQPDFECFSETLYGLYLCDPEKAINLFKDLLKKEIKVYEIQRDNDLELHGRVFMAGYVCNIETTKTNINNLVSIDVSKARDDVRNLKYRLIPSSPTTLEAIDFLKNALKDELKRPDTDSATATATAKLTLMSTYGVEFDMNDKNYMSISLGLMSSNEEERLSAFKKLESFQKPVLAS
jgi:hypothetical protein